MTEVHVFTSAAANYLPKARALFRSLRKYQPNWVLHLALCDELPESIDIETEPFDHIWAAKDLDIPDFRGWAFCHSIVELSTAIKPFMLKKILQRSDCKYAIYLDPDIVLFSPIDDILEYLGQSNIVLTPHVATPESALTLVIENEISSLKHGIYNLGFLGVAATPVGIEFAEWWSNRLYYFCRADIPNGLFTDQRWIDLVPAFFEGVGIIRNSRFNVATWNLPNRKVTSDGRGGYLVDDQPLGFYHFTGFDSGAHFTMAQKNSNNNTAVSELVEWYTKTIELAADDPISDIKWAFGQYTDGTGIQPVHRLIYRESASLQRDFPDPFVADGYLNWLRTRGRQAFPQLDDPATSEKLVSELRGKLTPGFTGGRQKVEWREIKFACRRMISDPSSVAYYVPKAFELLKSAIKKRA